MRVLVESDVNAPQVLDLADPWDQGCFALFCGNGSFARMRCVGDSPAAVAEVRRLLGLYGFEAADPPPDAAYYRPGDECYRVRGLPEGHPQTYAFLQPAPDAAVDGPPLFPAPAGGSGGRYSFGG